MHLLDPKFRPSLEQLESRETPANLTATFDALTHTLTVDGDGDNNQLQIRAVAADATQFLLSSPTDTINTVAADFLTPTGVKNITVRMFTGNDSTTISNASGPVTVKQNLTIHGGKGANSVSATDLSVGGNLNLLNGTNTTSADNMNIFNLKVGGSLTINNGDGDTSTTIWRNVPGLSFVRGNVLLTNGSGRDFTFLVDTNVGGNVNVINGLPNAAGVAGSTRIFNESNTTARSVIGGNVSFSYLAGNTDLRDGIWDMHILGNVTFNHGPGEFTTFVDGYRTNVPVKINGKLTLTGTGANQINLGTGWANTGVVVGGALSVQGGPGNDTLALSELAVGGATQLKLGKGTNTLTIDDSDFGGTFTLRSGAGVDTVNVDTTAGTERATTFAKAVLMFLGDGADTVTRAGGADVNQRIVFYRSFVIHHGAGLSTTTFTLSQEISPFGGLIQFLV
jgi:hypothetical protein